MFDPWGDGWWLHRYNKRTLWHYSWQDKMKSAVPKSFRPFFADKLIGYGCGFGGAVGITDPA